MSERRTSLDPGLESIRVPTRGQRSHERNNPPGMGDLFADAPAGAPEAPKPSPLEASSDRIAEMKKDLAMIAARMLAAAGTAGVTFPEVRLEAERLGKLTADEPDRTLSFGSMMMKYLGGVPTTYRPSTHPNSNGRAVRVFVHRNFITETAP